MNPPWRRWLPLLCAGALVVGFLAYITRSIGSQVLGSAGPSEAPYNLLVRGFQSGQLNLAKEVPAGLMRLADPYDPRANEAYRLYPYFLHDLSYYRGKLYLYFGAVPAVILFWPWAAVTGHYLPQRDGALLFALVGFAAAAAIALWIRRRWHPQVGYGVATACILALGLANGIPILLQWTNVYEVAIACAYAMAMLSFACLLGALAARRRRALWLGGASLFYGLAVGARPSLIFGSVILALPWCLRDRGLPGPKAARQAWTLALAATVPLALIGLGLMAYNLKRFGQPFEFGQSYQLLVGSFRGRQPTFSPRYFAFNIRLYFLHGLRLGGPFPFLRDAATGPLPLGHGAVESPFGVLVDVPLVWLALAAPLGWRARDPETKSALRGFTAALAFYVAASAIVLGLYWWTSSRYEEDFLPALVLLAVLGILGLERIAAPRPGWRIAMRCVWGALLAVSLAFNLAASFQHRAEQYADLGHIRLASDRPAEAVADFRLAVRWRSDRADFQKGLNTALLANAQALLANGRVPEAIAAFQEYIRRNPRSADAENRLGFALARAGRPRDAIAHFNRAVEFDSDMAQAHANLGLLLGAEGRNEEAIVQLRRALELQPDFPEARDALKRLEAQGSTGYVPTGK